jgi:hypothetical protein
MAKRALVLTALPLVLVCGALAANAQQTGGPFIEHSGQRQMQQQPATEGQAPVAEDEEHEQLFGPMMGGAGGMRGNDGSPHGPGGDGHPTHDADDLRFDGRRW